MAALTSAEAQLAEGRRHLLSVAVGLEAASSRCTLAKPDSLQKGL